MAVFKHHSPIQLSFCIIVNCALSMSYRSVYLHNNELTDTGLPDHMFNGSDNLEILTMSSNFLRVVPRYLPSTLYRLHLKVGICFADRWCYTSGFSLMMY